MINYTDPQTMTQSELFAIYYQENAGLLFFIGLKEINEQVCLIRMGKQVCRMDHSRIPLL